MGSYNLVFCNLRKFVAAEFFPIFGENLSVMAFQKDYILRMIEMMGDLIAAILGLIKKGEYEVASRSIDNAFNSFLKEDASFFNMIPKEELTERVLREHHYTNDHLEILSELFFAQGELLSARGKSSESLLFYEKSFILLDYVVRESKTYSLDKEQKLSLLKDKIESAGGNPEIK